MRASNASVPLESDHNPAMRSTAVVGAMMTAVLLVSACGGTGDSLYSAVPKSDWPRMEGVSVVSSKGIEGNQCCEAHAGSRRLLVRVTYDENPALHTLQQSLADAGWTPTRCAGGYNRSKQLCTRRMGLFAVLRAPHSEVKQDKGLVSVDIQRSR